MKKLLFLIPTLTGGGAETVLVNLVNNLDSNKYDITVKTLFNYGVNKDKLSSHIKYESFFPFVFKGNIHFFKLFTPKFLANRIIGNENYDIIISYLEGVTTRILGGYNDEKTKLISWVHIGYDDETQYLSSYRNIDEFKKTYNNMNQIVFVSKSAKTMFNSVFNDIKSSKVVKYNVIDDQNITELSNVHVSTIDNNDDTNINLISVGRFAKQKGYMRLIRIINKLKYNYPNLQLYLIGEGNLESQYIKTINEYNLENNIHLLGYQKNPYKFVKKADLFICSSYEEGFSTAVTESLIVGTPVITTDCSGMVELLGKNNEYGIITENSEDALYEGIKQLLDDKNLLNLYTKKAKLRSKMFNKTETVKEIENLFDSF